MESIEPENSVDSIKIIIALVLIGLVSLILIFVQSLPDDDINDNSGLIAMSWDNGSYIHLVWVDNVSLYNDSYNGRYSNYTHTDNYYCDGDYIYYFEDNMFKVGYIEDW